MEQADILMVLLWRNRLKLISVRLRARNNPQPNLSADLGKGVLKEHSSQRKD